MNLRSWLKNYWASFSYIGLIVGTLFFAASLTPSLLPRPSLLQGVLSGIVLAVGYGVGVLGQWVWLYLELPKLPHKLRRPTQLIITVISALIAIAFLWRAVTWQNSIRELMTMEPLEGASPLTIALIATLLAAIITAISRWVGRRFVSTGKALSRIIPRRISAVLGVVLVLLALASMVDNLLVKNVLNVMDNMYLQADSLTAQGVNQPENPSATGSKTSLIRWDSLGQEGQRFVANGPTKEMLNTFLNKPAMDPIRVYAGLRSAPTNQDRAKLALEELKRAGGFDRSILIIGTPTGKGWHDAGAVDSIEYLHAGDTAIVSMQYSYLPSWLILLVDPTRSTNSAKALFNEIYGYWTTLPKDTRPELYLYGMSLGSLSTEVSADPFALLEDTVQGGVLAGPPFASTIWPVITKSRNPGSHYWLPTFRDGSLVRFTANKNALDLPGAKWGDVRFVYLQHASDPMVFFSTDLLFKKPEWLIGERGPDVSSHLKWYPIVTFLQLAFDLPSSASVPAGYAHHYSAAGYIDAWIAVTQPDGWDADNIARLKAIFAQRDRQVWEGK